MDGVLALIFKAGHHSLGQCIHCGQLILRKNSKTGSIRMSDFNANMQQIRFPLGLSPRPRWGSLQRSPDPVAAFKGPTSKGREVKWEGREEEGRGEGKERGGKGGDCCSPNWGVWIRQWRKEGKGERQGGELGLGRLGTTFFHFKHCTKVITVCQKYKNLKFEDKKIKSPLQRKVLVLLLLYYYY